MAMKLGVEETLDLMFSLGLSKGELNEPFEANDAIMQKLIYVYCIDCFMMETLSLT